MPTVNYNGYTVSDNEIKNFLEAAAIYFEKDINVTSGDRTYVPEGGSTTSLHLKKRAVDFHVVGYDDATAFLHMKVFVPAFFAGGNEYEFILHGIHTQTGGAHLHLGRYGDTSDWGFVHYKKEGTTSSSKGVYSTVYKLPLVGVPKR
jgi:hypothetical protein